VVSKALWVGQISFNKCRFSSPGDRHWFTEKIRFILRLAASKGKTFLVLGAIDFTSGCPPPMVAREMKNLLEEKELEGGSERLCSPLTVVLSRTGHDINELGGSLDS
jgi:hypothetical protein